MTANCEQGLFPETHHASCVARDNHAVLLLGRSGAGKSDLALRLIDRGFRLVADDRVQLRGIMAAPPESLHGLIEARGLGILRLQPVYPAPVRLAVVLDQAPERLPALRLHPELRVPLLSLSPWRQSAALLVEMALDCVLGHRTLQVGFMASAPQQTHGGFVTET